jgi:alpha-mannosidase
MTMRWMMNAAPAAVAMPLAAALVAAALVAVVAGGAAAQVPKRIYIAPDDHTDFMWSASEAAYLDYFPRALDAYLQQIDETAAAPADQQAKWNTDGSLWMAEYERQRTPAQMQRLMDRVRDGHISMPLNTLVSVRGAMPLEANLRDMYYAGRLERRYNLRFPLAMAMENQTQPLGLGSVFASAGARYSWKGVCACVTNVIAAGNRERGIYWWVGPDGSRLLTKWMPMQHPLPSATDPVGTEGPGGYAEARFPREVVPFVDSDATFRGQWPYGVIGVVGQGWDDAEKIVPLSDSLNSFPAVARDLSNASRRVIVSDTVDFFRDFEAAYGAGLPSEAVSFGNEWELAVATIAEKSARVRRSTEKLRAAEAMATLVALNDPVFLNGREAARDAAFQSMGLYFEHDIAGGGRVGNQPRIEWQERQAAIIERYVDTLHADAGARLGQFLPSAATGQRFFVFNPLGFSRTGAAEIAYPGTAPFTVLRVGGAETIPAEAIGSGADRRIRFLATSIPSIGYRLYEVRDVAPAVASPLTASYVGGTLASPFYRLAMDGRGAIRSLIEPARGNREWVRIDNGLGLNDLGEGSGNVTLEANGPVSATLRADISGPQARTVRVTVYAGSGRIDLENTINGNFDDLKTYSFPFNIDAPLVRHEEVGVIATARLAPAGSYSARGQNTLYQWLTLNHFADMTAGSRRDGITLSNSDAYFMQIGNSTLRTLDITTPRIDVLAAGRGAGNPQSGELPNQGGDTRFTHRFSLLPHAAYSQANAMRFALEAQNPFATGAVSGPARGAVLPSASFSLLTTTSSQALLWAVKPAEEGIGAGVIVRLWNQGTTALPVGFTVNTKYQIAAQQRTTSIETNVASDDPVALPDAAAMRGNQIATFRLTLAPR